MPGVITVRRTFPWLLVAIQPALASLAAGDCSLQALCLGYLIAAVPLSILALDRGRASPTPIFSTALSCAAMFVGGAIDRSTWPLGTIPFICSSSSHGATSLIFDHIAAFPTMHAAALACVVSAPLIEPRSARHAPRRQRGVLGCQGAMIIGMIASDFACARLSISRIDLILVVMDGVMLWTIALASTLSALWRRLESRVRSAPRASPAFLFWAS